MIITRTPFRFTLGGGGTDLKSFYKKKSGFLFSMAINKYMYLNLHTPKVGDKIVLHYSISETVSHASKLRHNLAREALIYNKIYKGVEISSLADIPAGTGMGSSSSYLVGLLKAIHHHKKEVKFPKQLAEEACKIEGDILKSNLGKQDQYLAAFGGLTKMVIDKKGKVKVSNINISDFAIKDFINNTHVYFTGKSRKADKILNEHEKNFNKSNSPSLTHMSEIFDLSKELYKEFNKLNFDRWAELTDKHWEIKKKLSNNISYVQVDEIYDYVKKKFGVKGGKIIGAGGGGFLLLYTPYGRHQKLEDFLNTKNYFKLNYDIDRSGSSVIFDSLT